MKLINSRKVISKILENHSDSLDYDFPEEDYRCPCWEIKVDRDRGDLVFLIDAKEIYAYPLKKLEPSDLTIESLSVYMRLFKTQDLKMLAGALKK
jgi:hypothetical protein